MAKHADVHADVLLNVAHIAIFRAVAARPAGCDAHDIIHATNISQAKVYRDLKTLADANLINTTEIRTGAGYKKTTYHARYNKITITIYKDRVTASLEMV